jgi:hypothetical protein
LSKPKLFDEETYMELLADRSSFEDYDLEPLTPKTPWT